MADDIDRAGVTKAYARWAPIYDLVFGAVFDQGRKATIAAADRIGGRVLDVGVGTGLSLSDYARTTKLVGVDISAPMLRKAQDRVKALGLTNVELLAVMDAKAMALDSGAFDAVVAQKMIPDEDAKIDEKGVLNLKGRFQTAPKQVKYQLGFIPSDGLWKLSAVTIDIE